jgi:hypothetical protein
MIVKDYKLIAANGRHIRTATKVILDDGTEIKFTEKLTKREAVESIKNMKKETGATGNGGR